MVYLAKEGGIELIITPTSFQVCRRSSDDVIFPREQAGFLKADSQWSRKSTAAGTTYAA